MNEIKPEDYDVRIANGNADIENLKKLDDLAFAGHRGITINELHKVDENGVLLILYNVHSGDIVGESQLLFHEIPEIPYSFKHPAAYMYAVAIRPEFQAHGLGRIIMRSVWAFALGAGATEVHLSVRVTNYPSLRLMFGQGYHVIGYREKFYGPSSTSFPRVILVKKLNHIDVEYKDLRIVRVPFDGPLGNDFSRKIESLLSDGFIGIGIDKDRGLRFARF